MARCVTVLGVALVLLTSCARLPVEVPSRSARSDYGTLDRRFAADVQPVLKTYCYTCHSGASPASMLDLSAYGNTAAIVAAFPVWEHVHGRLERRDMPPPRAPQPSDAERRLVNDWIADVRNDEAERHAGDPGLVLARRLSNAEFNYTVQDLTDVDISPTRDFPVDPANEAGFDNSGETLAVSPALLGKYLDAARNLADHIVFTPRGFDFAPHVVVTDPDRDRYVVNRIMAFYRRQPTDLADYFVALWRYENRLALGLGNVSLAGDRGDGRRRAALPGARPRHRAGPHGRVRSAGGPARSLGRDAGRGRTSRRSDGQSGGREAARLRDHLPEEARLVVRRSARAAAAGRLAAAGDVRQPPGGRAPPAPQPVGADLGR